MSGFTFASTPPPGASAYFREKNLRPAFRWTEVWGQEHAHAFTVAKATQLDVLSAIQTSLQRAIDGGVPYKAWAAQLQPELERLGWWGVKELPDPATGELKPRQLGSPRRLRTIYDANLRTARAAGQWERAQRTKAVLPYFVYELGPSEHHRPEHEAREGMVAPVDSAIWDSWFPPNGWGCKCWLQQITRTAADARGGPTDLGDLDAGGSLPTRTFRRRRDDGSVETTTVPRGIDPGWASNPGKARTATLMQSLAGKLETAGPAAAKGAIADLWTRDTAQVLPILPGRWFAPAAIAPAAVRAELGASAAVVKISSDTLAAKLADPNKQGGRPLRPQDVGRVQRLLDQGELVQPKGRTAAYVLRFDDGWWKAAVKSAAGGAEILVSTLFPVREETALNLIRREWEKRAEGR